MDKPTHIDFDRIHRGDLSGLNIAGLVRLSFELDPEVYSDAPTSGKEIDNKTVQEEKIRLYVQRRGGTYVGYYVEPKTSAYKKRRVVLPGGRYAYRVIRPVFQGALENLKDGVYQDGVTRLDGLAVYNQDRLVRDPRELEDAIEVVEYWHRPIIDIQGSLDLVSDNGRQAARHIVAANYGQSAATARRLRDSHAARAAHGIPVGGRRRFGWKQDHTLDPVESAHLRGAIDDLLAGVNANSICRRWNEQGVLTTLGNLWERPSLVALLRNPGLAGWQVHQGKIARDRNNQPIKGQHEALIDHATWLQVCEALKPKNPRPGENKQKRVYLLSGVLRCGLCGSRLHGSRDGRIGGYIYYCMTNQPGRCRGVTGSGRPIDGLITDLVLARLAERTVEVREDAWDGQTALDAAERKIAELMTAYDRDELGGAYVFPRVREKEAEIAALREEQAAWLRAHAGPSLTNVPESWHTLEVEQRRAIVETVIEAVVLRRPIPGGKKSIFNPDRLEVIWK